MTFEDLRRFQRLLDDAFRVPGTNLRVGLDPLIGLVPWAGDLLTALMSCVLLVHAQRLRVPRIVQLRMLLNVLIDIAVGAVPVVGDVSDMFWKANAKNFALLERHTRLRSPGAGGGPVAEPPPPTAGDWLFVGGAIAIVLAVALAAWFMLYWIVGTIARM